jgi:hypothetical protein
VFTSADLIEALRRRGRRSLRPETPGGEFPPGWRAWFAAMGERLGTITGATADAIVAILVQRELRPVPRRGPLLNRAQAFAALWRQQWSAAGPEDRLQRISAFAIAAMLQLVFFILLLWLAYARYGGQPPPLGEEIVQVEYIGEGTPKEQGGGAPSGPRPQPQAAAAASSAARPARPARQASAPNPAPAQPSPATPQPQPPAPAEASQPLQATEVAEPDVAFVVPPPQPRTVAVPEVQLEVPQLQAQPEALPAPAPPLPAAVARTAPTRTAQVQVPALEQQVESLPVPGPPLPGVTARSVDLPQARISVPGLNSTVASLPSPANAPGNGSVPAGSPQPAGGLGTPAGAQPAATGAGAGAGPEKTAKAGAWDTSKLGDDWGASDRNQAGGQPGGQPGAAGLFDKNGRPRLPPGTGAHAGGGLAPGIVTEDIGDLDHAGTWLKRPPIDYSPTAFDRYWMPGGTLLEEWVRKGVREVQIRIPGTSKRIHCVVSILQLGGGCGINDPDMQDQEAVARPPPDIPWKPELQEK